MENLDNLIDPVFSFANPILIGLQPFALKIRCFCHYALISESNEMMSLKGHGQEPELFNPIGHPAGRKSSGAWKCFSAKD
ncbi:hypothetical protein ACOSP7_031114 [Xanthoceras sorbifolium]